MLSFFLGLLSAPPAGWLQCPHLPTEYQAQPLFVLREGGACASLAPPPWSAVRPDPSLPLPPSFSDPELRPLVDGPDEALRCAFLLTPPCRSGPGRFCSLLCLLSVCNPPTHPGFLLLLRL